MKHLNIKYSVAMVAIFFCMFAVTAQAQNIYTVAGNDTAGYSGDGGAATSAKLYNPIGVAVDASGNLFIADFYNNRIRKVSTSGVITTVAGNGTSGYSGDGGAATSAELNYPISVAVDGSDNLYIVDYNNTVIRKVATNGTISTVAGNGITGYSGDGGAATSAELNGLIGVAVDGGGNLYIADPGNNRIRKVSTNGIITPVAGNGYNAGIGGGYSGDGGAATSAALYYPQSVYVDGSGNLYIADAGNNRIRKVSTNGIITTVAGNGTSGYSGDGGTATSAKLNVPTGVAVDRNGNLYIADTRNNVIRKVATNGIINTVAGNSKQGYSGDGGPATSAELNYPNSVAEDGNGNLYIVDQSNNVIREVVYKGLPLPVGIASFTAKATSNSNLLQWRIANEANTDYFVVERSNDNKAFTAMGTIKAIGSGANSYAYTDNNPTPYPLNGVLYYRLQIVDKDGSFTFSKVVSVQLTVDRLPLTVAPNPSKDKVTVMGNHISSIQVIDNLGRVIKTQTLKDATNPTLSVNALPVGVYHLRVQTTDGKVSGVGFVKE